MNRRTFLEAQVFPAHERTQQKAIAHDKGDVPEGILLERGFICRKPEYEPRRGILLDVQLEILEQAIPDGSNLRDARLVRFFGKGENMFGILARKRPEEHVLGFGKTAGQHRRERILEALAVEHQLVTVLFICKPEFGKRAGESLGTARP